MLGATQFLKQIHERSVWQLLGAYAVGSWLVLQFAETLSGLIGLPLWFGPFVIILLVLGAPVLLLTAWIQGRRSTSTDSGDEPSDGFHGLATWKNALIGGLVAFSLLAAVTAAYSAARAFGIGSFGTLVSTGQIDSGDRIVLADFEDLSPNSSLAGIVTELVRTAVEQSPTVRLLAPNRISSTLRLMELTDTTTLDLEVAQGIAAREGLKAVLTGDVATLGGSTIISARLIGSDGETLVTITEQARDSTELLDATNRLSNRLRERTGESLRSIRSSPPLSSVMTSSIQALRFYTESYRFSQSLQWDRAVALLQQAVELDSTFALAYVRLAGHLRSGYYPRPEQINAMTRAFELRDRLPPVERLLVEGRYHGFLFRNDSEKTLQAYHSALVYDSTNASVNSGLAFELRWQRDHEGALKHYKVALAQDTLGALRHLQVIRMLINLGRDEEADSVWRAMQRRLPDEPWTLTRRRLNLWVWGEYEEYRRLSAGGMSAAVDLLQGKIERGLGYYTRDSERWRAQNRIWKSVITGLELLDQRGEGVAYLDSLERSRIDFGPSEPDKLNLAYFRARFGEVDAARELLREFDAATPEELIGEFAPLRERVLGAIEMAEGNFDQAVASFRRADVGHNLREALPDLAEAYRAAGVQDSAIAVWERFVTIPYYAPGWVSPLDHAMAFEQLGRLYDEREDLEQAALYYAKFVELWADADPQLQPRVQAAQARLEEIVAERG